MKYDNPDEIWLIEMIFAKHAYLRPMQKARIPDRLVCVAVLSPDDLDTRNHVPVFDDELRRFAREWIFSNALQRTCCQDENAILCLVSIQ